MRLTGPMVKAREQSPNWQVEEMKERRGFHQSSDLKSNSNKKRHSPELTYDDNGKSRR